MALRVLRLPNCQLARFDTAWLQLHCISIGHTSKICSNTPFETAHFVLLRLELSPWSTKQQSFSSSYLHMVSYRPLFVRLQMPEMRRDVLKSCTYSGINVHKSLWLVLPVSKVKSRLRTAYGVKLAWSTVSKSSVYCICHSKLPKPYARRTLTRWY